MADLKAEMKRICSVYGLKSVESMFREVVADLRTQLESLNLAAPSESVAPVRVVKTAKEVLKDLVVVLPPPSTPVSRVEEAKTVQSKPEELSKLTIHKLTIDKRVGELKAQGIVAPFPVLTKEAMKSWLETDGMTYWKIAEMTGAQDQLVSAMAKVFGLQSNASKMIQFKKNQK